MLDCLLQVFKGQHCTIHRISNKCRLYNVVINLKIRVRLTRKIKQSTTYNKPANCDFPAHNIRIP